MKATRTDTTFTLTGNYWSSTYPVEMLPKWFALYQRQQEVSPKSAHHYDETVRELAGLHRQIS